jgi:hypothetical protein
MAVVTRYFSTSSAGAGDGTTWADRAELLPSGGWSTVITGFDFATNGLLALIGPGTHACSQTLNNTLITTDPSAEFPLILHGCDSSGVPLAPPNAVWTSAQPTWDASGMPVIATTGNLAAVDQGASVVRLLKFTMSGATTNPGIRPHRVDWCIIEHSGSHTSAAGVSANFIANSSIVMTGTAYNTALIGSFSANVRIEGNASASSGNRYGITASSANPQIQGCTLLGHPGGAVVFTSASTSFSSYVLNNMVLASGVGILLPSTASQSAMSHVVGNYIANCGTYGLDAQSGARVFSAGNRLRDNTSGNFNGFGNYPTTELNYTTDSDDASEFADSGAGDYRIAHDAAIAGMGFGVSEEPAPGGGGGGTIAW